MNWMLTFHIMPDETIVEDSTKTAPAVLGPTYTVFLTNKRVLFRFNAIGSSMTQSFTYQEIEDVQVLTRLLIPYLCVRSKGKEFFIHTPNPGYWSSKILETKKRMPDATTHAAAPLPGIGSREELRKMIITLQRYNILTAEEVENKLKLLDTLPL
jgi:hypothetical protein